MSEVTETVVPLAELTVDHDGNLVIPRELMLLGEFVPGDPVFVARTEDGLLLLPLRMTLPKTLLEASASLLEQGRQFAEALAALDEVKEEVVREKYGSLKAD